MLRYFGNTGKTWWCSLGWHCETDSRTEVEEWSCPNIWALSNRNAAELAMIGKLIVWLVLSLSALVCWWSSDFGDHWSVLVFFFWFMAAIVSAFSLCPLVYPMLTTAGWRGPNEAQLKPIWPDFNQLQNSISLTKIRAISDAYIFDNRVGWLLRNSQNVAILCTIILTVWDIFTLTTRLKRAQYYSKLICKQIFSVKDSLEIDH